MLTFILIVTLSLPGLGESEWHSAATFTNIKDCVMAGRVLEQQVNARLPGIIKLVECGKIGYSV